MAKTHITNNSEETQKLAAKFAKNLKRGEVIALYGDLGSGKTTFTQGLAHALGIHKKIISPTFIIIRSYHINRIPPFLKGGGGISSTQFLYHIDLYRVHNENDLLDLGFDDILTGKQNIVVIEWPEKIEKILPKNRIKINFEYLDENKRQITISKK